MSDLVHGEAYAKKGEDGKHHYFRTGPEGKFIRISHAEYYKLAKSRGASELEYVQEPVLMRFKFTYKDSYEVFNAPLNDVKIEAVKKVVPENKTATAGCAVAVILFFFACVVMFVKCVF